MPSHTKENYLKSIYAIAEDYKKITLSLLSRRMSVSIPTANNMVKRLQDEGWVVYKKYKPLELTEKGRLMAIDIIRRHRLAEMFLVEKMGLSWEFVHDIAEEMEHITSSMFFNRIDELLNYPTIDPHGTPIPDKNGNIIIQQYIPLSSCDEGATVEIKSLTDESVEFLTFLNKKKIELGTKMKILKIEPFDESRLVSYDNSEQITLTRKICELLLVESSKSQDK